MGMSPSRLFELVKHISETLQELERSGIHVEIGDNFAKYRSYRNQQPDRGPIYPMFDATGSYVDQSNGFWICGFNPNGELIHTQAVRLLDLSEVSLGAHLSTHRHKYITPDSTPDPDMTYYSGPEALETITGKVCYQGDFWLHARGLGGPRSQGATSLLSRVLFEVMVGTWDPSFVFALVPHKLAAKGAHLRYGYTHCEPGQWLGPDQQVTDQDHLIWMAASDMANMLARPPQGLHRAATVSPIPSMTVPVDTKSQLTAKANV